MDSPLRGIACAVGCWLLLVTLSAAQSVLLVDDFNGDIQNHLGGYRDKYAALPSQSTVERSTATFFGDAGRSLQISVHQQDGGFCGAWVHLFDFRARAKKYFDARHFTQLSFWVRGEQGGEKFDVRLADKKWISREDSVLVGDIETLLDHHHVTKQWQRACIPLEKVRGVDLSELGGITFDFPQSGTASVFIDDVAFSRGDAINSAKHPSRTSTTTPRELPGPVLPRAMWVWSSATILPDEVQRKSLIDFCVTEHVGVLWMQIGYRCEPPLQSAGNAKDSAARALRCHLEQQELWRQFLREAHSVGIRVHVLDGYPEFAGQAHHRIPLAVVDAVIDFNHRANPSERFDGIHFDNEPYLLVGWHDPQLREQILGEFLSLNVECQARVHQVQGLEFGVDIPFWWHELDANSNKPVGDVLFRGKRQAASLHCLDLLDNVGIMNYRDSADGADGLIVHGRDLLNYASQPGKARVFIGVETSNPQPAAVWFALGKPRAQFSKALHGTSQDLAKLSRLNDLMLHTLEDGKNVHVGIAINSMDQQQPRAEVLAALHQIVQAFGSNAKIGRAVEELQVHVAKSLERNSEWRDVRRLDIRTADGIAPGFVVDYHMPSKITFADDPAAKFEGEIGAANKTFALHPSFAGWAIHDYDSYRLLIGR